MQCLNLQQALFLARNASLASMKIKKPKLCSDRTTPSRSWNQCNSLVKNNHLSKETVSSLFVTAQLCEDITRKAEIGSLCLYRVTLESSKHKKGETLNNAFCKTMAKEIVRKEPDKKYLGQPCSVTCVGTAYDHIHTWPFTIIKPEGMRYDGYLRLRDMNQFAREYANGKEYFPDIFYASSSVIADIFRACKIDLPVYAHILSYDDYMGDKSIGRAAIEKIELAWQADPNKFRVDKKKNRLIYSYPQDGPWYELKYIADELPNSLEAEISGGNQLVMNYEQAQELFGIKFRRWLGIFNL